MKKKFIEKLTKKQEYSTTIGGRETSELRVTMRKGATLARTPALLIQNAQLRLE